MPAAPCARAGRPGAPCAGTRTLRVTRHVRKWLQLRPERLVRGRAFEGLTVTPHFLAQIDVAECPVTREPLAHATGTPSDASVDPRQQTSRLRRGQPGRDERARQRRQADHAWDRRAGRGARARSAGPHRSSMASMPRRGPAWRC
jgi:hypothetical protein